MMTISGTLPIQSQTVSVAMESLPQKQASAFKLPVSSDWYPGLRMRNLSYSSTGRRWIPPPPKAAEEQLFAQLTPPVMSLL